MEILKDDTLKEELDKKQEELECTIGCRIKFDNDTVKVIIPERKVVGIMTDGGKRSTNMGETILTFSKREVKQLLQDIYTS